MARLPSRANGARAWLLCVCSQFLTENLRGYSQRVNHGNGVDTSDPNADDFSLSVNQLSSTPLASHRYARVNDVAEEVDFPREGMNASALPLPAFIPPLLLDVPDVAIEFEYSTHYKVWGRKCWGYWDPWSHCSPDCYKKKKFILIEDECYDEPPIMNQSIAYKLCKGGACPLKIGKSDKNPFMKSVRTEMLLHGFHSGLFEEFGKLLGELQILIVTMMLMVVSSVTLANHLEKDWLPDIVIAIPIAACCAMVCRYGAFAGVNFGPAMNAIFRVAVSRIMNDVLIPISIFEGAYHIQRKNFFSQFGSGIFFAVAGTLLCTFLIAPMVKFTGQMGWHPVSDWRQAFAYAAFIADTDPVATLSVFSNLKVDALLSTLVGGEATLNDPVALVIFGICNVPQQAMDFEWGEQIFGGFVLLGGSIFLGLTAGVVASLFIRIFRVRGKGAMEAIYVLLSAYACFIVGEYVGLSGIITVLFAGLTMGVYARDVLHDNQGVDSFLFNAARLADMTMFIIIGFSFFLVDDRDGVKLGLYTILFCFISRAIMVCLLVPVVNLVKTKRGYAAINPGRAFMLFHTGIRGGMTMMMALMLDPYWAKDQNTMVVATVVCVTGMAYLCGCTGPFFLKLCAVPTGVDQADGTLFDDESRFSTALGVADDLVRQFVRLPVRHITEEPDDFPTASKDDHSSAVFRERYHSRYSFSRSQVSVLSNASQAPRRSSNSPGPTNGGVELPACELTRGWSR